MALGSNISAGLNYNPSGAGNPYSGIMAGPAGLAANYGLSYNNALQANQQNYNNIIGGYETVLGNVGNTLGQGGGWGVAAPAAQSIADTYAQQSGGAMQNSINKGIGNTTAASAAQRGAALDANKAYAGLGAQLAQTYAGYEANLGQSELNFMNGVQIPYPNGAEYSSLYQQYGEAQQTAAQLAQQMALSQQQLRMSAGRSQGSGGGGGGGTSIASRPRGGTYGSGGGGFASGSGGDSSTTWGLASGGIKGGPSTSSSGGSGSVYPNSGGSGGFDPWSYGPGSDAGSNAYDAGTAAGSALGDIVGNFGNTGYWLGSGVG